MADFNDKINEINNTADTTCEFDAADIEQNKVMAIFAYLSWLVLIPIFGAKSSKFARFHANQGLVLAIVEIICWVVLSLFTTIPFIGLIFIVVEGLLSLCCLALAIIGLINVANGKAKELPIIGKIKILK